MEVENYDFSGWATVAGLKCSDGRTITPQAFKHMDGLKVPLVWMHGHNSADNVLGHVLLQARDEGVYCYAFFNDTPQGKNSKLLVEHGDVESLSIWANKLKEKNGLVHHGQIREVSLVLSGANPGAKIDFVSIRHSDDWVEDLEDEIIIWSGLALDEVYVDGEQVVEHSEEDPTIQEIYDSMTEEQQTVCHYIVGQALEDARGSGELAQSDTTTQTAEGTPVAEASTEQTTTEGSLAHKEGQTDMGHTNVFEQTRMETVREKIRGVLSHDAIQGIFADAKERNSLRGALKEFALQHGIDDLSLLFPEARTVQDRPEIDKRRTEWVASVINGTHKTPFSKIKSLSIDLTLPEARAKGYVTGSLKKEEWIGVTKRTTGSTTVYKKQKMDRDDIIDITDFDIVDFLWQEIRLMLEEEIARAVLIGDGREVDDDDKIKDPAGAASGDGVRSILHDHDLYAQKFYFNLDADGASYINFIDGVISARQHYKGSGTPTLYTTEVHIAKMLTLRDTTGRRIYRTLDELAAELRVAAIVPVEAMQDEPNVIGILVNLMDYNIGTNKGGEIAQFDFFDIDYNQYKYLMETRLSGALVKLRSAQVFMKTDAEDVEVVPNAPTFVDTTGVVTIVATTNVVYKNRETGATMSTGAQSALAAGEKVTVIAVPAAGYYISSSVENTWTFQRLHS